MGPALVQVAQSSSLTIGWNWIHAHIPFSMAHDKQRKSSSIVLEPLGACDQEIVAKISLVFIVSDSKPKTTIHFHFEDPPSHITLILYYRHQARRTHWVDPTLFSSSKCGPPVGIYFQSFQGSHDEVGPTG